MFDRTSIARKSLLLALSTRASVSTASDRAICPIDLCERLGIEIRFAAIPSLEGMYVSGSACVIILSSLRPSGRRRYTCAHELGHHLLSHGYHVDKLFESGSRRREYNSEEFAADLFAGHLLMTKKAVTKGFCVRDIEIAKASPTDIYQVSGWLGVGYATLIQHMSRSLGMMSEKQATMLLRKSPAQIKSIILGDECLDEVYVVDSKWVDRPVDVEVGDLIIVPASVTMESSILVQTQMKQIDLFQSEDKIIYRAVKPGIGRLIAENSEWAAYVRCSRKSYTGIGKFRHLDDDEES